MAIKLPSTAEIIEDELSLGMSSSYDETFDQWLLSSETPKKEFTVPVMFAEAGTYSVTVGETATVKVEITKAEPNHSSEEEESQKTTNKRKKEIARKRKQDEEKYLSRRNGTSFDSCRIFERTSPIQRFLPLI